MLSRTADAHRHPQQGMAMGRSGLRGIALPPTDLSKLSLESDYSSEPPAHYLINARGRKGNKQVT